jgi:hypothetical protein
VMDMNYVGLPTSHDFNNIQIPYSIQEKFQPNFPLLFPVFLISFLSDEIHLPPMVIATVVTAFNCDTAITYG